MIRTGVLHSVLSDDWSSGDKVNILIKYRSLICQQVYLCISWEHNFSANIFFCVCAKINEIVKEEWSEDFLGECQNKRVKLTDIYL